MGAYKGEREVTNGWLLYFKNDQQSFRLDLTNYSVSALNRQLILLMVLIKEIRNN